MSPHPQPRGQRGSRGRAGRVRPEREDRSPCPPGPVASGPGRGPSVCRGPLQTTCSLLESAGPRGCAFLGAGLAWPGLVRSPPAGGSRGQTAPRVPSGDGRLSPSTQAARARWRGDFNGTPPADLAEKEQEGSSSWEQPGRLEEARRVLCAQRPVAPASRAEVAGRQRGLRTGSGPHGCQRSSCCTASAVPP